MSATSLYDILEIRTEFCANLSFLHENMRCSGVKCGEGQHRGVARRRTEGVEEGQEAEAGDRLQLR